MGTVDRRRSYTVEEYQRYEASIEGRAEYRNGLILVKGDETLCHSQIATNFLAEIWTGVKEKPFVTYTCSLKIHIDQANCFLYPDLSVGPFESDFLSDQAQSLDTPLVIVEVMSETSAIDDVGFKLFTYQQLTSLREYILVDQFEPFVTVIHRKEDGEWTIKSCPGLDATIEIKTLDLKIPSTAIYRKVKFPSQRNPQIEQ
jgi:Uma2 family endonuclease